MATYSLRFIDGMHVHQLITWIKALASLSVPWSFFHRDWLCNLTHHSNTVLSLYVMHKLSQIWLLWVVAIHDKCNCSVCDHSCYQIFFSLCELIHNVLKSTFKWRSLCIHVYINYHFISRLFQYGCRLAWGRLQHTGKTELLKMLKNVEFMLSMTRKCKYHCLGILKTVKPELTVIQKHDHILNNNHLLVDIDYYVTIIQMDIVNCV